MPDVVISLSLHDFAVAASTSGGLTALAIVCCIQYAWHLYVVTGIRRERERLKSHCSDLEAAAVQLQAGGELTRLENALLREFLSEPSIDMALTRLLRQFVPLESPGFAALVQLGPSLAVRQAVGLSEESSQRLEFDPTILYRLNSEPVITLKTSELAGTALERALATEYRRGWRELHIVRSAATHDRLDAVLLTTSLFPASAAREQQHELATRLMAALGRYIRRSADMEAQQEELRLTRDILELRSIVDLEFHSPQEMIEEFLDRLISATGFHQASVYLKRRSGAGLARLAQHSSPIASSSNSSWTAAELGLAQTSIDDSKIAQFGLSEVRDRTGTAQPGFSDAVTVPMQRQGKSLGVLCLTRIAPRLVTAAEIELIEWAASYLLETILKTADRVAVENQARQDALTGLANRHMFDQALEEEVRRAMRKGRECALVLLDLDRFKSINDRHGHQAGDDALRAVAQMIRDEVTNFVRGTDKPLAARYGGEELALILPGMGASGAQRIAERIRSRVERSEVTAAGVKLHITLSAGVAAIPRHAQYAAALVRAADRALYEAKSSGRNCVLVAEVDRSPRELAESHVL